MHRTIEAAMAGEGKLGVYCPIPGKRIIRAVMEWPDGEVVVGGISTSLSGALDDLEKALQAHETATV